VSTLVSRKDIVLSTRLKLYRYTALRWCIKIERGDRPATSSRPSGRRHAEKASDSKTVNRQTKTKSNYLDKVGVEDPSSCVHTDHSEYRAWTRCTDNAQFHCTGGWHCQPRYSYTAHNLKTPAAHYQLHKKTQSADFSNSRTRYSFLALESEGASSFLWNICVVLAFYLQCLQTESE